jgi:hypothetical protein
MSIARPPIGSSDEDQASFYRRRYQVCIEAAKTADVMAEFAETAVGQQIVSMLEKQVSAWKDTRAWDVLDDDAKREQGKALRSRELLGYFSNAKETAQRHRDEAQKIADVLERAAERGRIQRV